MDTNLRMRNGNTTMIIMIIMILANLSHSRKSSVLSQGLVISPIFDGSLLVRDLSVVQRYIMNEP